MDRHLCVIALLCALVGDARADCHLLYWDGTDAYVTDGPHILPGGAHLTCDRDTRVTLVDPEGYARPAPEGFDATVHGQVVEVRAPRGAHVTIDGTPVRVKKGRAKLTIDHDRVLALDVTGDSWHDDWWVAPRVQLRRDGADADVRLWVNVTTIVQQILAELAAAETTPVAWAQPPDHHGPVALFGCPDPVYLARGVDLYRDVSMVAICTRTKTRIESCQPGWRTRVDTDVRLIEAQTGVVVATKTFPGGAPPPCESDGYDRKSGTPSYAELLAWIDAQP